MVPRRKPCALVRAVNVSPSDLAHRATRETTMEGYWARYKRLNDDGAGDAGPVSRT
jgi:hypothetical protein